MGKTRKKRKKIRLKYSVKKFIICFIAFLIIISYTGNTAIKVYKQHQYEQTYEYKLQEKGYTSSETATLIEILSGERLNYLLEVEYDETYYNIITQKYYLDKNLEKYYSYKKLHEDTSYENIIALVNVHASDGWYNVSYETNTDDGYLMIVNKFYYLNEDYQRDDLESISLAYSYAGQSAATIVIEKFINMRNDIYEALNVNLMINSSYRSYEDQELIYNTYKTISLQYADSYAARPGYSEHQTGLAIDITSLEHPGADTFKESAEYEWLKNNCYKYGFILRYPEGKEEITGYNTESWHFRYVGQEAAKTIYEEDITFDEYYAYYIEK